MKHVRVLLVTAALTAVVLPIQGLAWGSKGHTIINHLAAQGFAGRMPAFLSAQTDVFEVTYLGPEMDRIKGAGDAWDGDFDPGHYVDILDDGTIGGVVSTSSMPKDREAYDTALRTSGSNQYRQGYLPYEILDGWEQLRQDFAYWRADDYAARHGANVNLRERGGRDRAVIERVIAQDLGVWGHFVGDGCQPLHTTVHYNGWGNYPNPNNYTQSRDTHAAFESDFVDKYISEAQVAGNIKAPSSLPKPSALLSQSDVMNAIMTYLVASNHTVPNLYQIEKQRGFATGSTQAVAFTVLRLAAGVEELRDLSAWAWQDSAYSSVGYPEVTVRDVVSGKVPWPQGYGE